MLEQINISTINQKSKNTNDSFFTLFGDIDEDSGQAVVDWILSNNYEDNPPEILTLMLNTCGGELASAFAIIDVIRGSHIPVRTIGIGQVASAGVLILAAGEPGMRIIGENCSVMSHQYFYGSSGKYHELMAAQKEFSNIQKRIIKFLVKVTKMTEEDVDKHLMPAHDAYLTVEEAVQFGICDHVKTLK